MDEEKRIESRFATTDGSREAANEIQNTAPLATQALPYNAHSSRSPTGRHGDRPLHMAGVADSLPGYDYGASQQLYMQQMQPMTNPHVAYQYSNSHYSGPSHNFPAQFTNQILMPYQAQRQYGTYDPSSTPGQHLYTGQSHLPNQVVMADMGQPYYQHLHSGSMYLQPQTVQNARMPPGQLPYGYNPALTGSIQSSRVVQDTSQTTAASQPNTLRGPPRKPKQSGHALWVGNLPPGANIVDLKDHFSRDATNDIESVFLISKSNCAFVNYKSDQSCTAAMSRFHDSRFQGVRLVCRLRRGSAPGAPSSARLTSTPSPKGGSPVRTNADPESAPVSKAEEESPTESEKGTKEVVNLQSSVQTSPKVKERFFVIKSLTLEDLERSVHSCVWATQSHNEITLNQAYEMAESVYLIFSVNKSGEYFGYARMESSINDESAAALADQMPDTDKKSNIEARNRVPSFLPLTIPTPATATAPKGHIIDDSARGTIFWEAEYEDNTSTGEETTPLEGDDITTMEDDTKSPSSLTDYPHSPSSTSQTTYGKPFKISWQSTDRLPFYRTRGLRNPWNANREVKIARDGTEIEPSIGRRLVDMFGTQAAPQSRPPAGYAEGLMTAGSGILPPHGPGYGRGY